MAGSSRHQRRDHDVRAGILAVDARRAARSPRVMSCSQPAATIMAFKPMANIPGFGACMSPMNPQVIAATAAALGVFTPQPCIPVTTSPWAPGFADSARRRDARS